MFTYLLLFLMARIWMMIASVPSPDISKKRFTSNDFLKYSHENIKNTDFEQHHLFRRAFYDGMSEPKSDDLSESDAIEYDTYGEPVLQKPEEIMTNRRKRNQIDEKTLCLEDNNNITSINKCTSSLNKSYACGCLKDKMIIPCESFCSGNTSVPLCVIKEAVQNHLVACDGTYNNFCFKSVNNSNQLIQCKDETKRVCFKHGEGLQPCKQTSKSKTIYETIKSKFLAPILHFFKRRSVVNLDDQEIPSSPKLTCKECKIYVRVLIDKSNPRARPDVFINASNLNDNSEKLDYKYTG